MSSARITLERFTDLMRIADSLTPLWQMIEQHQLVPPVDDFDRLAAIDAFNAACQQRLPQFASNSGTTVADLVDFFGPNRARVYWFQHESTASPIETIRQTARFNSLNPADWR